MSYPGDGHILSDHKTISGNANGNAVVPRYSSMPHTPPLVHARESTISMDFNPCTSLAHLDNPTSPPDTVYREYSLPASSHSIGETSTELDVTLAEAPEYAALPHVDFKPTLPSELPRYERGVVIQNNTGPWLFGPLETLSASGVQVTSPWQYHVQPEGQPYYSLANESHRFSYLTEANVADPNQRVKLEQFIIAVEKKGGLFDPTSAIPANAEVVLEISDNEEYSYYMVDTDRRLIFWLEDYDFSGNRAGYYGVGSKHHFQHVLTFEFWLHIEYFPISYRKPVEELMKELLETLNYFNIDSMTSIDSTVPYGQVELRSLINSVKDLQAVTNPSSSNFAIVSLARLMGVIANERFFNFYGFHGARLSVTQSVRGKLPDRRRRSMLMKCLSPALFYAPENYMWRLERIWVDGVLRERSWQAFHDKLDSDLSRILLLTTILLASNAGLLIFPNMPSSNDSVLWSSPAEATSLVSAVASVAGIFIGLQLKLQEIRINAMGLSRSMSHAIAYLTRGKHEQLNVETLAVHYSLPYAMLMWGVVTFSASLAILCFDGINGTPSFVTRILFGAFWVFIVTLVLWSTLTGWEFTNYSHWSNLFAPEWLLRLGRKQDKLESGKKEAERTSKEDELSLAEKASPYMNS